MFLLSVQHSASFRSEGTSHFDMSLSKCFIASPVRLCTTSTMFQHSSMPKQDCPGHRCRFDVDWIVDSHQVRNSLGLDLSQVEPWQGARRNRSDCEALAVVSKATVGVEKTSQSYAITMCHHVHEAFCGASPATLDEGFVRFLEEVLALLLEGSYFWKHFIQCLTI